MLSKGSDNCWRHGFAELVKCHIPKTFTVTMLSVREIRNLPLGSKVITSELESRFKVEGRTTLLKPHHPFHSHAVPHKLRTHGVGDVFVSGVSDRVVAFDVGANDEGDTADHEGCAGDGDGLAEGVAEGAFFIVHVP